MLSQTSNCRFNLRKELDILNKELKHASSHMLGYPCNTLFDYSELNRFFRYPVNNVGDPFVESTYRIGTRRFEREALKFFARLYKIPKKDFWGYVTSGGTEGNMYGLFIARELYPDATLFYSEDTHYSVSKIARVLKLTAVKVHALPDGQIDCDDLERKIQSHLSSPIILSLNIGTTMKGGIDRLDKIIPMLKRNRVGDFYIHCDCALFGMILPFLKKAPKVDFTYPIGSIAISGHKFIGSPMPCGIVLARKAYVKRIERAIDYVGTLDTTIAGSRNGLSPLFLWYAIKTIGAKGFRQRAIQCRKNAEYLYSKLKTLGIECFLNDFSNTVVFKKPSQKLCHKYLLAVHGSMTHVVVMPHVTKAKLDSLFADLRAELQDRAIIRKKFRQHGKIHNPLLRV